MNKNSPLIYIDIDVSGFKWCLIAQTTISQVQIYEKFYVYLSIDGGDK